MRPGSLAELIDLPPVWLVVAMALSWAIGSALPAAVIDNGILDMSGYVLIGAGVALMLWCALLFLRSKTSIVPRNTPDAMITDGPYRFSRNPIYLADAVILAGWIMVIGSPVALIVLPAFIVIIDRRFIAGEETVLREKFGDQFSAWTGRVRRWI